MNTRGYSLVYIIGLGEIDRVAAFVLDAGCAAGDAVGCAETSIALKIKLLERLVRRERTLEATHTHSLYDKNACDV